MSTNLLTDLLSGNKTDVRATPLTVEDLGWPNLAHWAKGVVWGIPAFAAGTGLSAALTAFFGL